MLNSLDKYLTVASKCFHTAVSDIVILVEALQLPAEGFHLRETAMPSALALTITLNFFSYPRQQRGGLEDFWRMDRRKISAYVINFSCKRLPMYNIVG